MSFASEEEVDCPCGETFAARLWNSVNLKEDPDLRSVLMGGELNVVSCPMCKGLVYTERFLLLHDPDAELLAFIHPKAREKEREFLEAAMLRDAAQAQSVEGGKKLPYPPVLFFGLESVVELLLQELEAWDQARIMEALAPKAGVNVVSLSPSRARAAGLPRRVPLSGGGSMSDRLRMGLQAVLSVNDALSVYVELLSRLESGLLPEESLSAIA